MTEQSTPQDVDITGKSIAVLGGTGDQGRGLARRFALADTPTGRLLRAERRLREEPRTPDGHVEIRDA
ncbi:NADPH-dependent F420 reductase, partial [Nocardiopsis alba]